MTAGNTQLQREFREAWDLRSVARTTAPGSGSSILVNLGNLDLKMGDDARERLQDLHLRRRLRLKRGGRVGLSAAGPAANPTGEVGRPRGCLGVATSRVSDASARREGHESGPCAPVGKVALLGSVWVAGLVPADSMTLAMKDCLIYRTDSVLPEAVSNNVSGPRRAVCGLPVPWALTLEAI